jgi:hypothetical protein
MDGRETMSLAQAASQGVGPVASRGADEITSGYVTVCELENHHL